MSVVLAEVALVFRVLDLIGVFLNGFLGGTLARRQHFDPVGFCILAVISALGGGILRDLMLMMGRPVAITDRWYLIMALIGAVVAWVLHFDGRLWRMLFPVADGLVLGLWTATGTVKGLAGGLNPLAALMMGLITAIGGGMIRDIAVGRVPSVFGGNKLYATPAVVSGLAVLVGYWAGLDASWLMLIATVLSVALVSAAEVFDWRLPRHTNEPITFTRPQVLALIRRAESRGRQQAERENTSTADDEPLGD